MVAVSISFPTFASETEIEYFEFSDCTQRVIHRSSFPNDENFKSLERQAEAWAKNHPNSRSSANVFQTGDEKSFGICLSVYSRGKMGYNRTIDALVCLEPSVNSFPLAGATYKLIKDQGALPSFACVKGCKAATPRLIHDLGYESPEDWKNVEYEKALKKFNDKCRRAGNSSRRVQ
mgnify:FL=1